VTERPKEPPWNGGAGLILCRGFKSLRLRHVKCQDIVPLMS
jgi:hypothetical protein